MKISEILWKAANDYLWDGLCNRPERLAEFTCVAISMAECGGNNGKYSRDACVAREWVHATFDVPYFSAFDEFADGVTAQGVRYAWLMFASMYAAELEARGEL